MRRPKLYQGLAYSSPERGLVAFYVPNSDVGSKLIVVKVTEQSLPLVVLLRRFIDEAMKPKWYERFLPKRKTEIDMSKYIDDLLNEPTKGTLKPREGRVVKSKGAPAYQLDQKRKGGRVVRIMPQQLRKIKEGQENA